MHPILSQLWATMSLQEMGVIALKVLASLGGAAIGLFATGWGVRGLCRLIVQKPAPGWLLLSSRWLGAAALGAAVWTWAFGLGDGFGFGGGSGTGAGSGGEPLFNADNKEEQASTPIPETRPAELLRVRMVRSQDYVRESKRYYVIDGETGAKTLTELLDLVKQRKEQNPDSKAVEVYVFPDSVAEVWGLVDDLKERLRPWGLAVNTHKMERAGP